MQFEFDALSKNNTWDLVMRPCDVNIIQCMWIYDIKINLIANFSITKQIL